MQVHSAGASVEAVYGHLLSLASLAEMALGRIGGASGI